MSDQISPVLMCTDATLGRAMLISSRLNQERLRRTIAVSVTSMIVGNKRLPRVQRLAWNVSAAIARRYFRKADGAGNDRLQLEARGKRGQFRVHAKSSRVRAARSS